MARKRNIPKGIETVSGEVVAESYCTKCMKTKRADEFYQALDIYTHRNGLSHICKSCEISIYDDVIKEFRNVLGSIEKYCQIMNLPFDENIAERIYELHIKQDEEGKRKKHEVSLYNQYIKTKFSERDFSGAFYSLDLTFSQETSKKYMPILESSDSISSDFWGGEYSQEDLDFLEGQYKYFKETTSVETHVELMYLKRICKKLLYLRQAEEDENYKLIGTLEKELKILTDTLGISPDKAQAAKAGRTQTSLGAWIKDIERFSPAEWLKNESKPLYEDVDGMDRYGYNFITRAVENFFKGQFNPNIMDEDGEMVDGGV